MEEKINIAEILKNKPQGIKLYDLLRNIDVELDKVHTTNVGTYIECTSTNDVGSTLLFDYSELGTEKCWLDGLQILLPSKGMRDWEKFSWKRGDVLISDCGFVCIFKEWASDDYTKFNGCYFDGMSNAETAKYSKVDNNITYGYIRDIENRCGGKLNLETLKIEKQTKFKDGDIVCISSIGYLAYGIVKNIDNSSKKLEYYVLNDMSTLKFEDWLSFEDKHIQPITETQQIILFDALEKEGKAWDAEKKQIVDLPKKCEFKPFDKVICRDSDADIWKANFFSHYDAKAYFPFFCNNCGYKYCLPYNEKTAKLIGTTNNVEG